MVMFNSYVKLPEGTSFDPLRHAGFRPIAAWLIALRRQELADLSAYIGRIASCADRREMIVGIAQLFFCIGTILLYDINHMQFFIWIINLLNCIY